MKEKFKAMSACIPSPLKKVLRALFAALFWLLVWYITAHAVDKEILIASPSAVFSRLRVLCASGEYWAAVASSLGRVFAGFAIGVAAGLILAALSSLSAILESLITPLVTAIKATPVASFIIIALVWLKTPLVPVFTSALMVTPVVCGAALSAIRTVDTKLLEMAKTFGFSKIKTLCAVYIPSILPHVRGAAVTSLGLSWKAGIAAEVLCTPRGSVGKYLYESKIYLETPDLFAWTLTVIAASLLLEAVIRAVTGGTGKRGK